MGQFVGCVEGMVQVCVVFNFLVVFGNVSFYNEINGVVILLILVVGGVGLILDMDKCVGFGCMIEGYILMVVGKMIGVMGVLIYLCVIEGCEEGGVLLVYFDFEKFNGNFVCGQICVGCISVCYDLFDGGLVCVVVDMVLVLGIGIKLVYDVDSDVLMYGFLFGEDQVCYLLVVKKDDVIVIIQDVKVENIDIQVVGLVGGIVVSVNGGYYFELDCLCVVWEGWLFELMELVVEVVE